MKILMIEDDHSITEMMSLFFKNEDWDATYVYNGQVAVDTFKKDPKNWDLITLDLNLPSLDGTEVAKQIRQLNTEVPIVMLTARDTESDQVLGLEDADDYVTKPFSPLALVARIKAIMRRLDHSENAEQGEGDFDVTTGHLKLSSSLREVYIDGQLIPDLTPKEFDLLRVMAGKPRQVFDRETLMRTVWDYEFFGDERTVDVHIKKLRQKIEAVSAPVIQTVWGVGYRYDDSEV